MSLYVLGGFAQRFSIDTPGKNTLRPTSVMLRRKIFDSRQSLEEMIFVDLCAGTGSMGIEALSRQANKVFFIEKNRHHYVVLKNNLKRFKEKFQTSCFETTKDACLKWLEQNVTLWNQSNCILYLDPPYEEVELYHQVLQCLEQQAFPGEIWLEADRQKSKGLIEQLETKYTFKEYKQGTSYLLTFCLKP